MPPVKDAIATILNRNAFYRDGYRLLVRISLMQIIVITLLVVSITTLLLTSKTQQVYFATTSDGRIINIVPLNEPYRSNAEVVAWAASTARSIMGIGYSNYREHLQQVSTNFTESGWASFNKALQDANIIEAITARKLVLTMDIDAAPEIKSAAVQNGVFVWYVQFPVTIKFDGASSPADIKTILRLQIVRVSTLQNPDGLSIEQWLTMTSTNTPGGTAH
jgi:intracellular multiplication protein IcmL